MYEFAQNFLTVFMSDSYGNISQGRFLQFFLQNGIPSQIKKLILTSIPHLWHLLAYYDVDERFFFNFYSNSFELILIY